MGWLSVGIAVLAAILLIGAGHTVLLVIAWLNAAINFWSLGIMHNFATEQSLQRSKRIRQNLEREGTLTEERDRELDRLALRKNLNHVPGWITNINLASSLLGVGLLLFAVFGT